MVNAEPSRPRYAGRSKRVRLAAVAAVRRFFERADAAVAHAPRALADVLEERVLLSAYNLSVLGYIGANRTGAGPRSALVADAAGNLYGTTYSGGNDGAGTVFEVAKGSNAITAVASFNGTNGQAPAAGVSFDAAGNLYGATTAGGASGDGTVFEIAKGSGAITALASFNGNNGVADFGGVIIDSAGNLYGTTSQAGGTGDGTVFEIAAGSNNITTVATFIGPNGANPFGPPVLDAAGNLYGTTKDGGSAGFGTVFEIAKGSNAITTLASFSGPNALSPSGSYPGGGLILDSAGNLYGTTAQGGTNHLSGSGDGSVFEVAKGSNAITTLVSFSGTNGQNPGPQVVFDSSGNLYGTTTGGGPGKYGTVFEIPSGTAAITTLASFTRDNGASPNAVTLDSSGNLFGSTNAGGLNSTGTIFKIAFGSGTINTLANFDATGVSPTGQGVTLDASGNLFGTTTAGGAYNDGTVFEIARGSPTITTLASFNGTNGSTPQGQLVLDASGNLFGTTSAGTPSNGGTVFEIAHGSAAITTLVTFNGANGSDPYAGLTMDSAGNLYGTTVNGGANSKGTVFELATATGAITTLASFNGSNGQNPYAGVVLDGSGDLFGTTQLGGANNVGTAFEIAKGTNAITVLASFSAAATNSNYPDAPLAIDAAGNLYGTTAAGTGADADGTVFEIASGSGAVTTLAAFNGANGQLPYAGVTLDASGDLFGTTDQGGSSNAGTVFEIPHGSTTITTLVSFALVNGRYPEGELSTAGLTLDSAGDLYGTTDAGGLIGQGTVFELSPAPAVTAVTINGDNPNGLYTAAGQPVDGSQRSMVEDVVYTFSQPVNIANANAAFTLALAGQKTGTLPANLIATAVPGSNNTQWAVSLTGQADGVLGSIANGEYSITINPQFVLAASDGSTQLGAGRTDSFYRLFGDINGDRVVNALDNARLKTALSVYNAAFDFNGDGVVNAFDNAQFKQSMSVSFLSDGFSATI